MYRLHHTQMFLHQGFYPPLLFICIGLFLTIFNRSTRESISIVTFGRSRATIDSLIETAMSFSLDKDVGNTVIYNIDSTYGSGN